MATQTQRADRAARVIRQYAGKGAPNPQPLLVELLSDLMVWCRREALKFPELLVLAYQVTKSEYLQAWLELEEEAREQEFLA